VKYYLIKNESSVRSVYFDDNTDTDDGHRVRFWLLATCDSVRDKGFPCGFDFNFCFECVHKPDSEQTCDEDPAR
jgi:hypothetical protein